MKQKIFKSLLILMSALAFTACPNNDRSRPQAAQMQAQPPMNPTNPTNPPQAPVANPISMDSKTRTFGCEMKGYTGNTNIYGTAALGYADSWERVLPFVLSTKNYEGGKFMRFLKKLTRYWSPGGIDLEYSPAARTKEKTTDMMTLSNDGLIPNTMISQSGFAGQEVELVVKQGNDLEIHITCKGTSKFKSEVTTAVKTNLVCKGKSSLPTGGIDVVDITLPLNSIRPNEEFQISNSLYGQFDSKATKITYRGSLEPDSDSAPEFTTTASLLAPATYHLEDTRKSANVDLNVTCRLQ